MLNLFSEFEFRRKIIHMICGISAALIIYYEIISIWIFGLLLIFGLFISLLSKKYKLPLISWLLNKFDRKKEKIPGKGALTLLFGIILVWIIFYNDKNLVCASVMIIALGDSFSHIFSKYFGKTKHPFNDYKMLEGTIAGIIASFIGAIFFILPIEAAFASVIAMLVEAINIKIGEEIIDDNITVPITAAVVVFVFRLIIS